MRSQASSNSQAAAWCSDKVKATHDNCESPIKTSQQPLKSLLGFTVLLVLAAFLYPRFAYAETTVPCVEGSEPLALPFGATTSGCTIGIVGDTDTFTFTANAGDIIRISMGDGSNASNTIDNRIRLFDLQQAGAEIGSVVNEVNAVLDITVPTSGTFEIEASDSGDNQAFSYELTLQRLNAPGDVTPIAIGDTLTESIGLRVDIDAFGFTANAGDIIRISMGDGSNASNTIDNRIQLYDSNGVEVGSVVDEVNAVLDVTLPSSGTFLILASDAGGEQTWNYGITLQRLNAPGAVTPIAFGETLTDTIGTLVDIDAYGFTANAGDIIRISMGDGSNASNTIDNRIQLYDSNGVEVGSVVDEVNAVLDVTLPSSGTFLILASDAGGEQTWNYGITLQRLNAPGAVTPIAFGETLTDTIGTLVDIDAYGFTANAGDIIRISMGDGSNASNTIDNRIQLYDSNGVEVGSVVAEVNAVLDVRVRSSGTFLILASDAGGEQTWNYGITLQRLNAPGAVTPIAFGETLTDTIGTLVDIDAYGFTANAGDIIRISMGDGSNASNTIDNRIQLYDSNGVEVGSAIAEVNAVLDVTLPSSGTFLILASDAGGEQTWNYGITLQRLNAPGAVTPIVFGGPPWPDTIGTLVDIDAYGFTANAGDMIRISMGDGSNASNTIDNRIQLYDSNGVEVGSVVDEVNAVLDVTLPSSGTFLILASDAGGEQTWSYNITLECLGIECTGFNAAPVITNPGPQVNIEGDTISLPIVATDSDVLEYGAIGLPAGLTIDPDTGVISGTLGTSTAGSYNVIVTVTDNINASEMRFTWTVNPAPPPVLLANPTEVYFGEVIVGASAVVSFDVLNPGTSPVMVTSIQSSDAAFTVLPPNNFAVAPGKSKSVNIDFTPTAAGNFDGIITLLNNAGADVTVNVLGRGLAAGSDGDIDTVDTLEFIDVEESVAVEQVVTVTNTGAGLLTVSSAVTNDLAFEVFTTPGDILPLTLNPAETRNLIVRFTAPAGAAGTTVATTLDIGSDDVDEAVRTVALTGSVVAPAVSLPNNSLVAAQVTANLITTANCSSVGGEVQFSSDSSSTDSFKIILAHQNGTAPVESAFFSAIQGAGATAFSGINACGLPDGVVEVLAVLDKSGTVLPAFTGTPAVKNTGLLSPPVLGLVPVFSLSPSVEICGTSRADTTVRIEGGASVVSVKLDSVTTAFCLDVPLRRNAQNILLASAIDDLDLPPMDVATAPPVQIVQVDLADIVVANAFSRPLNIAEINALVADGVISTSEAANFNVSMFTVVLTIGSLPVTISQPVVINPVSGAVSYGRFRGGVSFGGWSGGGGAPPPSPRSGGCVIGCAQIVVIKTESGQTIPGVIIIDGRIKTLKEFFQVGLALFNNSGIFDLSGMNASIDVPGGLTPIRAGIGLDVNHINLDGEVDSVLIGDIAPGETGIAQFLIRGDGIGRHQVDVDFDGSITGGGLPTPIPVAGSAATTVEVTGPPELGVTVSFPSNPVGSDVLLNQIYTLTVHITNLSDRPALYTSLELFVGGNAQLLDENDIPKADSSSISTPATILPGETQDFSFRVKSLAEGEIIACQAVAAENILLTVDTGPAGAACRIGNTLPANFVPLPPVAAPTLIAINPLNGESEVPLTSSVFAIFTPQAACIVADTWTNVVTANIDPFDPGKGLKVVSADLVTAGTFYLEELDWAGSPVQHIPVDLTLVDPTAGGTTIATLRLGLDSPHPNSQYFLRPDTAYRATIIGGTGGVCSTASGVEMNSTFSWIFNAAATCDVQVPPSVNLQWPANGTVDRTRNVQITLDFLFSDADSGMNFPATMDLDSFVFDPGDFAASSFGVYINAVESAGDITGGTAVSGTLEFSGQKRLYFVPDPGELTVGDVVHVRLTDQLTDDCGNPLETPPNGVKLFKFDVVPIALP